VQRRKNDTGRAAKLQLVFSSQEKAPHFAGTASQRDATDEGAEEPSLEALIQAVLNNNTEAIDTQQEFTPRERNSIRKGKNCDDKHD
jgi:hypothetical protein